MIFFFYFLLLFSNQKISRGGGGGEGTYLFSRIKLLVSKPHNGRSKNINDKKWVGLKKARQLIHTLKYYPNPSFKALEYLIQAAMEIIREGCFKQTTSRSFPGEQSFDSQFEYQMRMISFFLNRFRFRFLFYC